MSNDFLSRHLGSSRVEQEEMARSLGVEDLSALVDQIIPQAIRIQGEFELSGEISGGSESSVLARIKQIAEKNQIWRSYIGMGYYGTHTPAVITRNILENPGWYTQYTPYQAEISQGRLEALLNFQTIITELTGLPVANASLLDEATAMAEALHVCLAQSAKALGDLPPQFLISRDCHPQTIAVVKTRAEALDVSVTVAAVSEMHFVPGVIGVALQYPGTYGQLEDYSEIIQAAHKIGALAVIATDLLALTLINPPAEYGADIAVGSAQRLGVPMGFGGPHAGFYSCRDELKRLMPGRVIGVSRDAQGNPALRLALQTREQHIRREKATSNICTAQVLLAIMASMYVIYHGPSGLRRIAGEIRGKTKWLADQLGKDNFSLLSADFFDTLTVNVSAALCEAIRARAVERQINLRYEEKTISVSLGEDSTVTDLSDLYWVFTGREVSRVEIGESEIQGPFARKTEFLAQPVFHKYHSETEFLRYLRRLESKDLSLATAMIPLGSCTMKLNATVEMLPVTWPHFSTLHPFVPEGQSLGYRELISELGTALCEITGMDQLSFQPNAGSQGEYSGLLAIRHYYQAIGEKARRVCLIPVSAHGTNPASATMAGMTVVTVNCDAKGNIDLADLESKAAQHQSELAAVMVTYPSTHGVFEEGLADLTAIVHRYGGQVYLDGANLNALVGYVKPGALGVDVMHSNLHKTFCIPHGGGGPGVGPVLVRAHLAEYLPQHPLSGGMAVAAAPEGSASILPIPWTYIALMGAKGLQRATAVAILNANYLAQRLSPEYPVLYRGESGFVAHECILDCREFKKSAGVEVEDIAKRLMDYGFHAPTVSWPVPGTLMIEPTESESRAELDRFIEAMLQIREEIRAIENGQADRGDNPLKNAPHTALMLAREWEHPYSREQAAYPVRSLMDYKFWPAVGRVDGVYGDRNFVCVCGG